MVRQLFFCFRACLFLRSAAGGALSGRVGVLHRIGFQFSFPDDRTSNLEGSVAKEHVEEQVLADGSRGFLKVRRVEGVMRKRTAPVGLRKSAGHKKAPAARRSGVCFSSFTLAQAPGLAQVPLFTDRPRYRSWSPPFRSSVRSRPSSGSRRRCPRSTPPPCCPFPPRPPGRPRSR